MYTDAEIGIDFKLYTLSGYSLRDFGALNIHQLTGRYNAILMN